MKKQIKKIMFNLHIKLKFFRKPFFAKQALNESTKTKV